MIVALDHVSNRIAQDTIATERQVLHLGWLRPRELNDLGHTLQLTGDHFSDDFRRAVYTFCCCCGQIGARPTFQEFRRLADQHEVQYERAEPYDVRDDLYSLFDVPVRDGHLRFYVENLIEFHRRREAVAETLRHLADLLSDDAAEVIIRVREPKHPRLKVRVVA